MGLYNGYGKTLSFVAIFTAKMSGFSLLIFYNVSKKNNSGYNGRLGAWKGGIC